jgi:hypothetical protein
MLSYQAYIDLDNLAALRLFVRGLPKKLAYASINLDGLESFKQ